MMEDTLKKKISIPKINSVHYGGIWIGSGLLIGGVVPFFVWCVFHVFLWPLCVIGGMSLCAFGILFAIEMHQDFGKVPYYEQHLVETIPFDPNTQYAVIKSSICTGEQIAGFKNKENGSFTEVLLIKSDKDLEYFKRIYGIEDIKKEY